VRKKTMSHEFMQNITKSSYIRRESRLLDYIGYGKGGAGEKKKRKEKGK
jgi:hypothetical protein